jgi:hypothetical protein
VPSARAVQPLVDDEGWQLWQAFAGLRVPDGYDVPLIRQPVPHVPDWQICPFPHDVPFASSVQALVDIDGRQLWQALFGSMLSGARSWPPTKQPALHVPASQITPVPHAVPLARGTHAVVDVDGWQVSQVFAELAAPLATKAPAMKHPAWQAAALQTRPLPQLAPAASAVQALVDADGWQL